MEEAQYMKENQSILPGTSPSTGEDSFGNIGGFLPIDVDAKPGEGDRSHAEGRDVQ
jgi:hypothetical protein